jgi:ATP-binding cassette subfamily F protein uup
VLDEPTNDLDLETLDLLQEVIADYEGTVLIVSHDRDFLDRTVTVTLGLDGSGRSMWLRAAMRIGRSAGALPPACGRGRGGADKQASPPPAPSRKREGEQAPYKDQRDLTGCRR